MQMPMQMLGLELTDAETQPLSAEGFRAFRSAALALTRQIERTQRAVSELSKRCEAANIPSSEIKALRDVAAEIAGEIGSLAAIIDLATGELPGWGNANKAWIVIGADILRTARDLRRPAIQLSRVRAVKTPKRFAVGASVRVRIPGVNGVVTQLDGARSALSEYWHTIRTEVGERREPGCNLELIEPPITHASPGVSKIAETINFHGPNSRMIVSGNDNSSNTASTDEATTVRRIAGESCFDRKRSRPCHDPYAHRRIGTISLLSGGFIDAYKAFIASSPDHITVFGPFLSLPLRRCLGSIDSRLTSFTESLTARTQLLQESCVGLLLPNRWLIKQLRCFNLHWLGYRKRSIDCLLQRMNRPTRECW